MFRKHFENVVEMWAWSWDLSFIPSKIFVFNYFLILLMCYMKVFLINEYSYFNFTLNMFVPAFICVIMDW